MGGSHDPAALNPPQPDGTRVGSLRWLPVVASLWLFSSAVFLAITYEPLTPDSYAYVAAAQSFLDSGRFNLPFAPTESAAVPVPLSAWPPGYPLLIALVSRWGFDPWLSARLVAALCLVCVMLPACLWLRGQSGGSLAFAILAVCGQTATVATTIWSEAPFLLALSAAFAGVVWWRRTHGASMGSLWLAAGGLGLALLVRHAGWFVVPVVLYLLLQRARGTAAKVCAFTIAAVLPALLWLIGNRLEALAGRGWSLQFGSLARAFGETAAALGKVALVPWLESPQLQAAAGAALGLLLWIWGRPGRSEGEGQRREWSHTANLFGLSLLAGTWAARTLEPTLVISDRLIWPAWLFLACAAGLHLGAVQRRGRTKAVLIVALALTQSAGIITLAAREPRRTDSNQNIHTDMQLQADQIVISNEAWRAWRLFGTSGYYLPRSYGGGEVFSPDTLQNWARRRGVRHLIWFDDGLTTDESTRRYGPLGRAGGDQPVEGLELVGRGVTYHTYEIRSTSGL